MKYNTVIFDFDYTLADASEGIIECINYSMNMLKLPEHPSDVIRSTIGMTLPKTFEALTGIDDEEATVGFRRYFKEKADKVINENTIVFENVAEIIGKLRKNGFQTAIVSTKFRYRIAEILERDEIHSLFDLIVGGEDVSEHKPDPEGLNQAVMRLEATKETTVYIGDSVIDAMTAERAGVDFIAVLSGVTPSEKFDSYPSQAVLSNLSQLPELLINYHK